jgi:tRNA (guanine37-N1)-methyltransferase
MNFHLITLFPQMFDSYLNESVLARARKNDIIEFYFYNPRDFVKPTKTQKGKEKPYLKVDDKPYGGGPGMVIQAEPVIKAIDKAVDVIKKKNRKGFDKKNIEIIHLSPSGKKFDGVLAQKISKKYSDIIIVCGRYEGIDARVKKIHKGIEISIGDYVLTGGELPAMIIADSVSRQIEGVLGDFSSREESRVAGKDVYTRPETIEYKKGESIVKLKVPKILISGHHKKIEEFRKKIN